MSRSDLIDLDVYRHHTTDRAILVSLTGVVKDAVWVPLARCEFVSRKGDIGIITLSEDLATEKGLV